LATGEESMEGGFVVEGEEFGISTWYEYVVIFNRAIPRRAEGIALHYIRLTGITGFRQRL
jgi:hypothetical protein